MQSTDLKQVLGEQQSEAQALKSLWKEREIAATLQGYLSSQTIKVIMGIRRSGKSTLCLGAIPPGIKFSYVNFDDERLTSLTSDDLNLVYETLLEIQPNAKFFIFDEIQNIAHWELFANRLHRKKLNLLITGSNGSLLSRELATHLTGRHLSLELMPLSFSEYLHFRSIPLSEGVTTEERAFLKNLVQGYFDQGGFPEIVLGEPQGPYLRELFDKIISRDIVQRHRLRGSQTLKEMALYLVQQSGSFASLGKLQKAFDFPSINTVRTYLSYLQEVFLFYELQAYSSKIRERSTRPRKYFICDLGLWSALNTKPTIDLGMRLETLVFLHLKRWGSPVYYLKEDRFDVDFCVTRDRKPEVLIQVCYSLTGASTAEREIRSLIEAAHRYGLHEGTVVTWDQESTLKEDGIAISIVPVWKFLLSEIRR